MGALGCGNETMKIFLFISNFIFLLFGGGLLGIGIYLFTELQDVKGAFENDAFLVGVPISACLLGVTIMISSILGALGAAMEKTSLIKGFLIFQFIGLIFQIAVFSAVLAYDVDENAQKTLEGWMKAPFNSCAVINDSNRQACKWLAPLQKELKCCGFNQNSDYDEGAWKLLCQKGNDAEFAAAAARATHFCNVAILGFVKANLVYIYSIIGALFFITILVIIGSYCLISGIKQDAQFK